MLDLFRPPTIVPRPTRIVLLNGDGPVRVYAPRKITRPLDMSPKAVLIRARQAEWLRNKRRQNPGWREIVNARERERYAAMTPDKRAARLAQIAAIKSRLAGEGA
jgi:hypothetical protein